MQYFISHRGNIKGKNPYMENNPVYIDEAISAGYDVEIDLWIENERFWLGHDEKQYETSLGWILNRQNELWVHCKNHEAMIYLKNNNINLNCFWHQEDDMTLTSKGFMWVYPGKQPIKNSIAVMPEINDDDVSTCLGVCSDVIEKYRNEY